MEVITKTSVCDRCRRPIPSGHPVPFVFGPPGPTQVVGEICGDLPNACQDVILSVFWGTATVSGPAVDSFPR